MKTLVLVKIASFEQKLVKPVFSGQDGFIWSKAAQDSGFGQNSWILAKAA